MNYGGANEIPDIREFITSNRDVGRTPKIKVVNRGVGFAHAEMNGCRDNFECSLIVDQCIRRNLSVLALFDGHGGWKTAAMASYLFSRIVSERGEPTTKFLTVALNLTNEQLRRAQLVDGCSTGIVLRQESQIAVAHLGNTRVYLLRDDGTISFQTEDHTPSSRREYERIHAAGGRVLNGKTDAVVEVSRAIGDFRVPSVGHEPDVTEIAFDSNQHRWLVIGSHGVWTVIFPSTLQALAHHCQSAAEFAYCLRNMAFAAACVDNISVIVVDLTMPTSTSGYQTMDLSSLNSLDLTAFNSTRILTQSFDGNDQRTGLQISKMPSHFDANVAKQRSFEAPQRARGMSIVYFIRERYDEGEITEWFDAN
jgi:serine/threonine protein phosphatase PrpC